MKAIRSFGRVLRRVRAITLALAVLVPGVSQAVSPAPRVVWEWNEQALAAIRVDRARPTVQARNLFHVSAAMYDVWAAYDPHAEGYLYKQKVKIAPADVELARTRAMSRAAFTLLRRKYGRSPGSVHTMTALDGAMRAQGLDPSFEPPGPGPDPGNDPAPGKADDPEGVGSRVAAAYIALSAEDGSLEMVNYLERPRHVPINKPLDPTVPGIVITDPDRWQPLVVDGATQRFLTPHWKSVRTFALPMGISRFQPGAFEPPMISNGRLAELRDQVVELIRFNSWCDAANGEIMDASPGSIGHNTLGTDDGVGRPENPLTGQPYAPNPVRRSDFVRGVAEYWADGPGSDTPPGHWNTIARNVSFDPRVTRRIGGQGDETSTTERDVKLLFALNAALHDAAVASWDLKFTHDSARPVSLVRWMGLNGQCSDPALPSFHLQGLPITPGLIELVTHETTAQGQHHEHLRGSEGKVALLSWAGPPRPPTRAVGVAWRLAGEWMPYQPWDFTTPAFPGYVSGHSTFSRAAAEVLTAFTGSQFFPGGLHEVTIPAAAGFKAEQGPVEKVTLQWATYFDAADQSGLSRRWGGIHISADDFDGRRLGSQVGVAAWQSASRLFGE